MLKVKDILDTARNDLQDSGKVRWGDDDLLIGFNEGRRELVRLIPSANPVTTVLQFVAGTRQTITGSELLNVICNMGADKATPGRVIISIPQTVLESARPDLHTAAASGEAKYSSLIVGDKKAFLVFPPQPAVSPGSAKIVQSEPPIDTLIANIATEGIGVDDSYEAVLVAYTLYKAYSMDAEAGNFDRATGQLAIFHNKLGVSDVVQGR